MNLNNFTIKAQETIQQAQLIAHASQQQSIETGHLLKALLETDEHAVEYLLKKLDVNIGHLKGKLDELIESYPKVSGDAAVYLSRDANNVLLTAQNMAKKFKDEFVSVDHLLLAILKENDKTSKLLSDQGATLKDLKKAVESLRQGSKVTDQSAEAKYNALEKYARNLNELVKSGKLDPVIGRDEEIRRILHILS